MQTWKISLDQIQNRNPRAAHTLSLMAILDRHAIPALLLRDDFERESDFTEATGVLKACSLTTTEVEEEIFVLHRLVPVFTQSWLELQKKRNRFEEVALEHFSVNFPHGEYKN